MFGAFLDAAMSIPQMMHNEEMQNDAQAFNSGEAGVARAFNSAEAVTQRDWAERMSNTQYQRAASDMSSAGLNRILAMRQGGNMAGSGSSAAGVAASSSSSPGQVRSNFLGGEINSAQIANIDMDTRKKDAERSLASQHYNESQQRTEWMKEQERSQREVTTRTAHEATIAGNTAKGSSLEGEIDTTTYGKVMRYIDRAIKALTGGSSAYGRFRSE